ncbi:MAG: phosphoadenylyl-sulfate reductase [Verrucomicrobiales bacterium]|jgi:phosphoadenosine phosphosulfate reductase|nr:phosphoadenylyl-sulfate reductase [Verrucomicrobiales bacterium]
MSEDLPQTASATAVPTSTSSESSEELSEASRRLENASAEDRVAWALEHSEDRVIMTSSFGAQSAVLLHLATRQKADLPVVLIDTGYLFTETYHFIDSLREKLDLNLKVYRSDLSPAWQEARFGKLWEDGVEGIEKYNQMNKVEPMDRAMTELDPEITLSGIRRQQSSSRENLPVVARQKGRLKVHPIIDWTDQNVGEYLVKHDLPYHPLWEEGYVSIGDWHTSRKLTDGMSAEETRFFGLKRECGLHEDLDFVI